MRNQQKHREHVVIFGAGLLGELQVLCLYQERKKKNFQKGVYL